MQTVVLSFAQVAQLLNGGLLSILQGVNTPVAGIVLVPDDNFTRDRDKALDNHQRAAIASGVLPKVCCRCGGALEP